MIARHLGAGKDAPPHNAKESDMSKREERCVISIRTVLQENTHAAKERDWRVVG